MPLLIDGYNLLYGAGIVGQGRGPGGLERSRHALIRFVAAGLNDADRATTTIVFDAAGAPPGLPSTIVSEGITIRFARGYADADELLEELVTADHAPRKLTVVSSDHRVQRAAKRRRAKAIDSDVWYEAMLRRRADAGNQARAAADAAKPQATGDVDEVQFWLDRIVEDKETARELKRPKF
jgi:predicted RNA-binding protein with PIN domain